MSQQEANLQAKAEGYGEAHHQESDEERMARLEQEASDRLAKVGEEVNKERDA